MAQKTMKQLREELESFAQRDIESREDFLAAIRLYVEAQNRIRPMRQAIAKVSSLATEIADMAAEFGLDNPEMFIGKVERDGKNVLHGQVVDDETGETYAFTGGYDGVIRSDGENITQQFIATLPKEWTKGKAEIDLAKIEALGVSEAKLEKAGLMHKAKNVWSLIAA